MHSSILGKKCGLPAKIEDFAKVLQPMITLYAILDQLSSDFVINMNDKIVDTRAAQLAKYVNMSDEIVDTSMAWLAEMFFFHAKSQRAFMICWNT
jgi:hypothetical protein